MHLLGIHEKFIIWFQFLYLLERIASFAQLLQSASASCWGGDGYFKNRDCTHLVHMCATGSLLCPFFSLSQKTPQTKRAPSSVLRLHIPHYKFSLKNLRSKRCCENQFCFCLRFIMYWTSARLSKALNHAEMQWGLSIGLTALLVHSLCVQTMCVQTMCRNVSLHCLQSRYKLRTMTALRMLLLKYYLPLFTYDKCIKIVFTCSVPID